MKEYQFNILNQLKDDIASHLDNRPFSQFASSFSENAKYFEPGDALTTAINTAIAVGEPLLITGEAGTGKTQSAYYVAKKLGIEPVIHFQVKSDSRAQDLLYHFDSVRYFHDAHLKESEKILNKADYVEQRALWKAFDADSPKVVLIDEIDKAPRDFPNDLLHELDKMEFTVNETGEKIEAKKGKRPLVFITSNSERRLPPPFLRRCVYHHIKFNDELVRRAVAARRTEYSNLSNEFLELALRRFIALREENLRKKPATGELLVWLRVMSIVADVRESQLNDRLGELPYLETLLKDHQDLESLL